MKLAKIGCLLIVAAFLVTMTSVNLSYAPGAVISMNPQTVVANPGDTFTISIDIESVVDCYAWEVEIAWEPELLELVSVTEGPFLAGAGPTFFASTVDQLFGTAMFGSTLFGPIPGASGGGQLAYLEFLVQEAGKEPPANAQHGRAGGGSKEWTLIIPGPKNEGRSCRWMITPQQRLQLVQTRKSKRTQYPY